MMDIVGMEMSERCILIVARRVKRGKNTINPLNTIRKREVMLFVPSVKSSAWN